MMQLPLEQYNVTGIYNLESSLINNRSNAIQNVKYLKV